VCHNRWHPYRLLKIGRYIHNGVDQRQSLQISMGFAYWLHYCMASSSGRQPNCAACNRGRNLCSAGRPSRWALGIGPHFVFFINSCACTCCFGNTTRPAFNLCYVYLSAKERQTTCVGLRFSRSDKHCLTFPFPGEGPGTVCIVALYRCTGGRIVMHRYIEN